MIQLVTHLKRDKEETHPQIYVNLYRQFEVKLRGLFFNQVVEFGG